MNSDRLDIKDYVPLTSLFNKGPMGHLGHSSRTRVLDIEWLSLARPINYSGPWTLPSGWEILPSNFKLKGM